MLFPEEIFDLILKKNKIIYLEMKLNFNHRIKYQCLSDDFSTYTRKKLTIQFHEQPSSRIVVTNYFWENRWDLKTPKLLS